MLQERQKDLLRPDEERPRQTGSTHALTLAAGSPCERRGGQQRRIEAGERSYSGCDELTQSLAAVADESATNTLLRKRRSSGGAILQPKTTRASARLPRWSRKMPQASSPAKGELAVMPR